MTGTFPPFKPNRDTRLNLHTSDATGTVAPLQMLFFTESDGTKNRQMGETVPPPSLPYMFRRGVGFHHMVLHPKNQNIRTPRITMIEVET